MHRACAPADISKQCIYHRAVTFPEVSDEKGCFYYLLHRPRLRAQHRRQIKRVRCIGLFPEKLVICSYTAAKLDCSVVHSFCQESSNYVNFLTFAFVMQSGYSGSKETVWAGAAFTERWWRAHLCSINENDEIMTCREFPHSPNRPTTGLVFKKCTAALEKPQHARGSPVSFALVHLIQADCRCHLPFLSHKFLHSYSSHSLGVIHLISEKSINGLA